MASLAGDLPQVTKALFSSSSSSVGNKSTSSHGKVSTFASGSDQTSNGKLESTSLETAEVESNDGDSSRSDIHHGIARLLSALKQDANSNSAMEIHVPSSPQYSSLSHPFNKRLSKSATPGVILLPTTTDEVCTIVKIAKKEGLAVIARAGGHSYAGFSSGAKVGAVEEPRGGASSEVVVIDMRAFNSINWNDDIGEFVTIGGGCHLGRIAGELFKKGRALPHGVCPTVGLGGHALHGGYGPISRHWGLTVDRITQLKVILADGTLVTASETENTDIFWAFRGAGSSFGIAVAFTFRTYPVPQENTIFQYKWDTNPDIAAKALIEYQKWLPETPGELGIAFMLWKGNEFGAIAFELSGHYVGKLENYHAVINPFLSHLKATLSVDVPSEVSIRQCDWLETMEWLGEETGTSDTFYAKSLYIGEPLPGEEGISIQDTEVDRAGMNLEDAERLTKYLATVGGSESTKELFWFAMADAWGGKYSAINKAPISSMSYSGRSNLIGWQLYARSEDRVSPFTKDGIDFVNGMWNALVGLENHSDKVENRSRIMDVKRKCILNYVDSEFTREEAHKMYYSEANLRRLEMLKKQYDSR